MRSQLRGLDSLRRFLSGVALIEILFLAQPADAQITENVLRIQNIAPPLHALIDGLDINTLIEKGQLVLGLNKHRLESIRKGVGVRPAAGYDKVNLVDEHHVRITTVAPDAISQDRKVKKCEGVCLGATVLDVVAAFAALWQIPIGTVR